VRALTRPISIFFVLETSVRAPTRAPSNVATSRMSDSTTIAVPRSLHERIVELNETKWPKQAPLWLTIENGISAVEENDE